MGIQGLMKLLSEECPGAIKEQEIENYTGRKIAIDASMAMYQFLVAVRSNGPGGGGASAQLVNDAGEVTSHIQGMFNRTIKMMTSGVKPCYVFDGKPPQMKGGELAKRMAKRAKAETDLAAATDAGEVDDIDKFSRRLVKVTRQHNEECKELLRLMGVPVVDAPCEAEAQCAELCKKKKVYATATEDMDALTFRTPKLVRKMTFSQSSKEKQPIIEIDFEAALIGLELTYDQFVDLCILCGCDYCSTIKGIGPKTALKLIKQHKTLEAIIEHLRKDKKYDIPADWRLQKISKKVLQSVEEEEAKAEELAEAAAVAAMNVDPETIIAIAEGGEETTAVNESKTETVDEVITSEVAVDESSSTIAIEEEKIEEEVSATSPEEADIVVEGGAEDDDEYEIIPPLYVQARGLFLVADVHNADDIELKWTEPDEEGLRTFLCDRMGFSVERVNSGIKRLKEANAQKSQKRMDSFFSAVAVPTLASVKRKAEDPKGGKGGPNKKGGPGRGGAAGRGGAGRGGRK